jgi:hypothetical protein
MAVPDGKKTAHTKILRLKLTSTIANARVIGVVAGCLETGLSDD